jgi:PEP-utilizing family enzyme
MSGLLLLAACAGPAAPSSGGCGEMAAQPIAAVYLVGAGVDSLSMTFDGIPAVADAIRRLGADGRSKAASAALREDRGPAPRNGFATYSPTPDWIASANRYQSKGDKQRDALIFENRRLVGDLVKKGRSVGICVVLATQT